MDGRNRTKEAIKKALSERNAEYVNKLTKGTKWKEVYKQKVKLMLEDV